MMHRNHVTNTLTYENYCLKAKVQELLEKIAHLQAQLLTCHGGGTPHSRGDELPPSAIDPQAQTELQEELNKKNIEIEYLKEQVETLSQKSDIAAEPETDKADVPIDSQIIALQETITGLQNQLQTKTQQLDLSNENLMKLLAEVEIVKKIAALKEAENEHLKTIIAGKDAEIAHLKMTCPQP